MTTTKKPVKKPAKITKADKNRRHRLAILTEQYIDDMGDHLTYGLDSPMEDYVLMFSARIPAIYGNAIERKTIHDSKATRIPDSECCGDMLGANGETYEVKATMLTDDKMLTNFVQLRPWHNMDNYFLAVFDVRNLHDIKEYYFQFTAAEMHDELTRLNAPSAHGKKSVYKNDKGELRLSFRAVDSNDTWNYWLDTFLIEYDVFCGLTSGELSYAA